MGIKCNKTRFRTKERHILIVRCMPLEIFDRYAKAASLITGSSVNACNTLDKLRASQCRMLDVHEHGELSIPHILDAVDGAAAAIS
jgi:hypothetical protein